MTFISTVLQINLQIKLLGVIESLKIDLVLEAMAMSGVFVVTAQILRLSTTMRPVRQSLKSVCYTRTSKDKKITVAILLMNPFFGINL